VVVRADDPRVGRTGKIERREQEKFSPHLEGAQYCLPWIVSSRLNFRGEGAHLYMTLVTTNGKISSLSPFARHSIIIWREKTVPTKAVAATLAVVGQSKTVNPGSISADRNL
jgi:hypothetical protein